MDCEMCRARGKNWNGGDPICSFQDGGRFNPKGWNCATANAIREICDPAKVYCDDQYYATVNVSSLSIGADALWVGWYKNRGRTEAMWLLNGSDAPIQPTESQALAIIAANKS